MFKLKNGFSFSNRFSYSFNIVARISALYSFEIPLRFFTVSEIFDNTSQIKVLVLENYYNPKSIIFKLVLMTNK